MELDMDIYKVILRIITELGGIGVVFSAVVVFSSNMIADKLRKKYQLKLDEELEKVRGGVSNKVYISKTKFDAEFLMYQKLSESFTECVKCISILIPRGLNYVPADTGKKEQLERDNFDRAVNSYDKAKTELSKSAPFITKELCNDYEEIFNLCYIQIMDFQERWNVSDLRSKDEKESLSTENYKRTIEINEKYESITEKIREYLSTIDVF